MNDMTTLADIRDLLQSTAIVIENVIELEVKLKESYDNLMMNAKAAEVAGLYKPNLIPMIQTLKEQRDILKNLQFAVESNLDSSRQYKWNNSIKKIPQKDDFELEGIQNWRISLYEMVPDIKDEKDFKKEAYILMEAGFPLAFNTDHGVGSINKVDDGFVIELHQDLKKKEIHKKTLDDALNWIINFYEFNK